MKPLHLFSAMTLMIVANLASAQIQRCVDSDGRVIFTDNLCPKTSSSGKSIKADQKYVGTEKSTDTNWAAKNEAFNQRHAQRELRADNERAISNFLNTPLPSGVKSRSLTTYSNSPNKLEYEKIRP